MSYPLRFQIVSDIHGSQMDHRACDAALNFCKEYNPHIRVIAGDLWDFSAIRKGASQDEQSHSMREDFECGQSFANKFFKGGIQNHLMLGNHDVRAYDLCHSVDATKADLGALMVRDIEALVKKNKAKLWPYDSRTGILEIGSLNVIHGFHTGKTACSEHSRIYNNVVFGHVHSIESYQTPGLKQKEARAIGCLCKLDQDYANRKTGKLRWAHGFVYGTLFENREYQLTQVRSINDKFYATTQAVKAY